MGRKSLFANARYAVANGDGLKARATIESIIANARHAVICIDVGKK